VKIGIGLPNTVLGATGPQLIDWAKRAEARGFSTLATIDRVAYPTYDSFVSLAAAAGATERIGLMTNVLLGPVYRPAPLAKVTASLAQVSNGRFRLGIGVGTRTDDYRLTGTTFEDRGKRLDDLLAYLTRAWRGEIEPPVGPTAPGGTIPIAIGGQPRFAARRAVTYDAPWTIGGGGAEMAAKGAEAFREAWREAGGTGEPRIIALSYFSLGDEVAEESRHNLRSYYGYLEEWADGIAEHQPRDPGALREAVSAFEAIGVEELIFVPTTSVPGQVDVLADVVL
jgi:alkanesulfonate monooxygenase SsuD/methylene tetrahydromethanopterin reductase-like flavin-dependent oxidoreductase (luciferase family)